MLKHYDTRDEYRHTCRSDDDNASSGNSVLAVTQQLSITLGVCCVSAAVLRIL